MGIPHHHLAWMGQFLGVPVVSSVTVIRQQQGTRDNGGCLLPYVWRVTWLIDDDSIPGYDISIDSAFEVSPTPIAWLTGVPLTGEPKRKQQTFTELALTVGGGDYAYKAVVKVVRISDDVVMNSDQDTSATEKVSSCLA